MRRTALDNWHTAIHSYTATTLSRATVLALWFLLIYVWTDFHLLAASSFFFLHMLIGIIESYMQTPWHERKGRLHVNASVQRIYVLVQSLAIATADPAMLVYAVKYWRDNRDTSGVVILTLVLFIVVVGLVRLVISQRELKETEHSVLMMPVDMARMADKMVDNDEEERDDE